MSLRAETSGEPRGVGQLTVGRELVMCDGTRGNVTGRVQSPDAPPPPPPGLLMKPLLSRRTYKIPPALSQMLPLLSLHPQQQVQHLRAVPPPPPVFLDLEVAEDEQVSPDKLRANLERLYMTVVHRFPLSVLHVFTSSSPDRRCGRFCQAYNLFALLERTSPHCQVPSRCCPSFPLRSMVGNATSIQVYFVTWYLSVLLATIVAMTLALIFFPSSRRAMLPPAWHLWKPRAGTPGTLDSLSGAPEAHQGEAVEQEASESVASFAANTLPEVVEKVGLECADWRFDHQVSHQVVWIFSLPHPSSSRES
ncbi:hypothetical protein C8Q74DRAFT_1373017 [Fomes fomentarius]|nr:hypothetical protein C8Q74DRAFT_1373017 [Fomes fomentarius]